ncbi:MAG: leucine-rich repeat domain-containing protein [Ruminococcaceae bacterium]|nr:leucine-rich repeat domain-containing protein [Oscillospiraceae bacterium]
MRRSDKSKYTLDVVSGIDTDLVDHHLKKRFELWAKKAKPTKNMIVTILAAAACFFFLTTTILLLLPNNEQTPISSGKQIPIYQGMTVANEMPAESIDRTATKISFLGATQPSSLSDSISLLHADEPIDQNDPYKRGEKGKKLEDAVERNFLSSESAKEQYYAKRNEDIYILIHVSNPDGFEILSFTLNGVKYSSYMFEKGSDLETLILKYNVGDVTGIQEYTIDAIKYVDGDTIKDVRMDGDKTVKVFITPDDQPTAVVTQETIGFHDLTLSTTVTDNLGLIGQSNGTLYAVIYDGETLISKQPITSDAPVTFSDLSADTLYQYAIVAVYDAIDGNGTSAHILFKKAFYTQVPVTFNIMLDGMTVCLNPKWDDAYTGDHEFNTLWLFEGEEFYADLPTDTTRIKDLPFDRTFRLEATYQYNEKIEKVQYEFQSRQSSKGLLIVDGEIRGLGSCTDPVLYLDLPISDYAFNDISGDYFIQEVYCGSGVTSIGSHAFALCCELKKVVLSGSVKSIDRGAFYLCESLSEVVLSDGLESIGDGAFRGCTPLESVIIPDSVTHIGDYPFRDCPQLKTVYCEAPSKPDGWNDNWSKEPIEHVDTDIKSEIIWGYTDPSS